MTDGPKEWKKPEVEDISSEEPGKDKVELTDEQKDHIREDLESDKYDTKEKATKRRKQLAVFYGANVKQIGAVSAYKRDGDKLSLEPKFDKPPPAAPQMEAVYDNPTKRAWREKIAGAIYSNFTKEQLHSARVVCLPGQVLQEVTEVYLPLGIQPQNIVCIESDPDVAKTMRASVKALVQKKVLSQPVTIFEGTVEKFLQSPHEPVTIASFDFLGPVHKSFLENLPSLRRAEKYMVVTNFLQKREQKDPQSVLRAYTSATREQLEISQPDIKEIRLPSEFLKSGTGKSYDKHLEDVMIGGVPVDLSKARDEGMIMMLALHMFSGRAKQVLEEIYAEVGASPPPFTPKQCSEFLHNALPDMSNILERSFEKYPALVEKLTPKRKVDAAGELTYFSNTGKRGFLPSVMFMMGYCLGSPMMCDIQRYEYLSESAGSPFQTDIFTQFDWGPSFKQKNRAAYEFVREFFRALGQHGKDRVSIQLERFNKPLKRSDGAVGITLALCVNGVPYRRVTLHNVLQLLDYYSEHHRSHIKEMPLDILTQPRIKIQAL